MAHSHVPNPEFCRRHLCKLCAEIKTRSEGGVCNTEAVESWPKRCGKSKCKMMHYEYDFRPAGGQRVDEYPCPFMNATGDCKKMHECPFKHTPEMRDEYFERARQLLTQLTAIAGKETIADEDFHTCAGLISNIYQLIRVKPAVMTNVKDVIELISKIVLIRSENRDRERVDQDNEILACLVKKLVLSLELNFREELLIAIADRAYVGNTARLELKLFAIAVFTELTRGVRLAELAEASWADDESLSLYYCVEHIAQLAVLEESGRMPVAATTQLQALLVGLKTKALHDWMKVVLKVDE